MRSVIGGERNAAIGALWVALVYYNSASKVHSNSAVKLHEYNAKNSKAPIDHKCKVSLVSLTGLASSMVGLLAKL